METSSSRCCLGRPIPASGAGSWHFLPTLHPSGSLPAFARSFPGNSTHGDGQGEEKRREGRGGQDRTGQDRAGQDRSPLQGSHGLPTVGHCQPHRSEWHQRGGLWCHPHHPTALWGCCDASQLRGWMARWERDGCPQGGRNWGVISSRCREMDEGGMGTAWCSHTSHVPLAPQPCTPGPAPG